MGQEQKDLLLKDLCARLPYGVKVGTTDNDGSLENVWDILWYNTFTKDVKLTHSIEDGEKVLDISELKPYLIPLTKMTKEQEDEWYEVFVDPLSKRIDRHTRQEDLQLQADAQAFGVEYLLKNHFDIYGLIPMELAIDATGLNIY